MVIRFCGELLLVAFYSERREETAQLLQQLMGLLHQDLNTLSATLQADALLTAIGAGAADLYDHISKLCFPAEAAITDQVAAL